MSEVKVMAPICPRCLGFIPGNDNPGAYPGAWSRRYRHLEFQSEYITEVCSACGQEEAMLEWGRPGFLDSEIWPIESDRAQVRREFGRGKTTE